MKGIIEKGGFSLFPDGLFGEEKKTSLENALVANAKLLAKALEGRPIDFDSSRTPEFRLAALLYFYNVPDAELSERLDRLSEKSSDPWSKESLMGDIILSILYWRGVDTA